jgi:hypothetical protein
MAAGGMPATGRDRDAWRERMVAHGSLAGNLYALRGTFVERVRDRRIRMPVGLVFEDAFVSWLVATQLGDPDALGEEPQCVFHGNAEFSFTSLSPAELRDYRTNARRSGATRAAPCSTRCWCDCSTVTGWAPCRGT